MVEFGIYVYDRVQPSAQKWANEFYNTAKRYRPNSFLEYLHFPLGSPIPAQRAIIVGGDGVVRSCIEQWNQLYIPPVIGIKAAGTSNVLYRALAESGSVMTPEEFLTVHCDDFAHYPNFSPGFAGKRLFTNTVSFNQHDGPNRLTNEFIREHMPRLRGKDRIRAAYVAGLVVTAMRMKENIPLLNMMLTTPFFGFVRLSPSQKPFSSELTRVSIEGESRRVMFGKLVKTLLAFNKEQPPPEGILRFERSSELTAITNDGQITLDGDLYPERSKIINLRRSEKLFTIVALN